MIGGTLFTHNCIEQDYCIKESLESLRGVCNEIVVVDSESTDGTRDYLAEISRLDARVRVFDAKWMPEPHKGGKWLADLANTAREQLISPFHIGLQADEVLHEHDYDKIRQASFFGRLSRCLRFNFWRDGKHIVKPGEICGNNITRMGPTHIPFILDAENLDQNIMEIHQSQVRIFHYGFIREAKAQMRKGIQMEDNFFGGHNPLYDKMDTEGRAVFDAWVPDEKLNTYDGSHPAVAMDWLKERGRL